MENSKTILLVEDDVIAAAGETRLLNSEGFNVIHVPNAEKAIEIAKSGTVINLILMDIDLGSGMDGTDAAEIILKDNDIPLVFLSGHMEKEIVNKTKKISNYGYIVKGLDGTVILAGIDMAIKLHDANKKISDSEHNYRFITENINDVIGKFDIKKEKYNYISPSIKKLSGYTQKEILNQTLKDIFTDESYNAVMKELPIRINNFYHGIDKDKEWVDEFQLKCKDGSVTWIEISTRLIPNDEGEITEILGISRSINEKKLTQIALSKSEEKYSRAFNLNPDAININRLEDGVYIEINQGFTNLTGYTPEDVIGKSSFSKELGIWVNDEERNKLVRVLKEHGEVFNFEALFRTKNGKLIDGLISAKIVHINNEQCILSITSDITERKQMERRKNLSLKILDCINRSKRGIDMIRAITALIKSFTDLDAVGIRIREGNDFPYFFTQGFPSDFIESERYLCSYDSDGEIIHDSKGKPVLECLCGNIICGHIDHSLPFFTKGGSFWTNSTSEFISQCNLPMIKIRNKCNEEGYESLALIPLTSGNETIGLLQFNDKKRNCFTYEMIRFFEGIGASIGIALKRLKNEQEKQDLISELKKAHKLARIGRWTWNIRTNKLKWSDEMYNIFGIEKETFSGSLNDVIQRAIHPEDIAKVEQSNSSVIMNNKPVPLEYRIIWPDGSIHTVWAEAGELIIDETGSAYLLKGIVKDITANKTDSEQEEEVR